MCSRMHFLVVSFSLIGCGACSGSKGDLPKETEKLVKLCITQALRVAEDVRRISSGQASGPSTVDASVFMRASAEMNRRGEEALGEFKKQFLALDATEKSLLLSEPRLGPSFWPMFTPAAGEFLASLWDQLPREDQFNAAYLIGRCGYKPAAPKLRKLYDTTTGRAGDKKADLAGGGLLMLGDYVHLPGWVATLVETEPTPMGFFSAQWICEANAYTLAIGPIHAYFAQASDREKGELAGLVLARALGRPELAHDPEEALKGWDELMSTDSGKKMLEESWVSVGSICYGQGRLDLAAKCFEAALERNADNVTARIFLGATLRSLGNHRRSIDEFTKALAVSPGNCDALVGRAAAFGIVGEYAKARQDLRECLKIKKDHPNALATLAEVALKEGKHVEARQVAQRLKALDRRMYDILVRRYPSLAEVGTTRPGADKN